MPQRTTMRLEDAISGSEDMRDRVRQAFDGFAERALRAVIQNEVDGLLTALDDDCARMIGVLRSGGSLIENKSDAPAAANQSDVRVLSSDEARAVMLETFARGMKPKN